MIQQLSKQRNNIKIKNGDIVFGVSLDAIWYARNNLIFNNQNINLEAIFWKTQHQSSAIAQAKKTESTLQAHGFKRNALISRDRCLPLHGSVSLYSMAPSRMKVPVQGEVVLRVMNMGTFYSVSLKSLAIVAFWKPNFGEFTMVFISRRVKACESL